jgi:hypothetical protein
MTPDKLSGNTKTCSITKSCWMTRGWMQQGTEFIVMTAVARGPNGSGYGGRYAKVAICEVKIGVRPKMISSRARGMVFIWELHDHLYIGVRGSGNHQRFLVEAELKCAELSRRAGTGGR